TLGITVTETSTDQDVQEDCVAEEENGPAGKEAIARANKKVGLLKRRLNQQRTGPRRFGALPEEREAVERIVELRRKLPKSHWRRSSGRVLARRSFRKIAAILNSEGRKTRAGGNWTYGAVRNVILEKRPDWLDGE